MRSHRQAITAILAALLAVVAVSCTSEADSPPSTPEAPADFTVVSKKERVPDARSYTVEYILLGQTRERVYVGSAGRACFEAAEIGKPLPVVAYYYTVYIQSLNADEKIAAEETAKAKAAAKTETRCR